MSGVGEKLQLSLKSGKKCAKIVVVETRLYVDEFFVIWQVLGTIGPWVFRSLHSKPLFCGTVHADALPPFGKLKH